MQCIDLAVRKFLCGLAIAVLPITAGCWSSDTAPPTASINTSNYGGVTPSKSVPERRLLNLHPMVLMRTSAGEFTVELDAEHAPLTVDNFLSYVQTGQYDGTIFHQVYDNFIVLGGGYDPNFTQRPTQPPLRNEAHNGLKNRRGTIAMARQLDSIDSATCQFFINLGNNTTLDFSGSEPEQYGYCVFGKVIKGMEVIDQIANSKVHSTPQFENVPERPVVIESIRCVP
ncbi:MAG TPA: peptidylprolyl isomerase [Pirellulales bacterium]|jgi:cyclophilin family peptidyl-prolyl cis-trans isomerase|nr:peptidylprolyl isomerase [Pirellulales bacterium]